MSARDREGRSRFLVSPDSFKGTFGAVEVAAAIGAGIEAAGGVVDLCPAADGGEGTAETVRAAIGGEVRAAKVHDPLGREIEAAFVLVEGGRTAVVDTAAASGWALVAADERDAEAASTYGTGELIAAAVRRGRGGCCWPRAEARRRMAGWGRSELCERAAPPTQPRPMAAVVAWEMRPSWCFVM